MTTTSVKVPTKILNAQFISIFFAAICTYMAIQLANTMVPKYVSSLGVAATIIGTISGAYGLTALGMKAFSGPMIDTLNRKYVFMGAVATLALAMFGYSISTTIPMLFIFRLVQGAAQTFTAVCLLTLAADALPPEKMGQGIGIYWCSQAFCQAIGASLGLKLIARVGYSFTFMIAGGMAVLAILLASRIKLNYENLKKFKFSLKGIAAKEAILPSVMIFLLSVAYININTFLVIDAGVKGVSSSLVGVYFITYAITMLVSRPLVGKLSDKFGFIKSIIPVICIYAGGFIVLSFATTWWLYFVAAVMIAFGWGAGQPIIQALAIKTVPKDRRGAASNAGYIGNDFGNMLGPVLAGVVIDAFGYATMWKSLAVPIGLALIFVLVFRKHITKIETDFAEK